MNTITPLERSQITEPGHFLAIRRTIDPGGRAIYTSVGFIYVDPEGPLGDDEILFPLGEAPYELLFVGPLSFTP